MPGGRIGVFVGLMAVSMGAAGLFGMAHNQLSYSVGPEYFTAFKFLTFGIGADVAPRWGAAVVGWQASWWMGAVVGLPVLAYGLMRVPSVGAYWAGGLGAVFTVIMTAAIAALIGLGVGFGFVAAGLDPIVPPFGEVPADAFMRAGMMHDFSYLGGLIGGVLAFFPMRRAVRHGEGTNG